LVLLRSLLFQAIEANEEILPYLQSLVSVEIFVA
jgi:hypothetical protein